MAIKYKKGRVLVYIVDVDSGLAENSPYVIIPDDEGGNKRLLLCDLLATGVTVAVAAGDPKVLYRIGAVDKWVAGVDDSDGDHYKITPGGLLDAIPALDLNPDGSVEGSIILDEDDMISDSDKHLATQQSIKEYVGLAVGSIKDFFLSDNDDPVIANYHILYGSDTGEVGSTLTSAAMPENPDQLMFSYITVAGVPGIFNLRAGVYGLHVHLSRGIGDKPTAFYWTLSKYTIGDVETVVMASEISTAIPTVIGSFNTHATLADEYAILATDRLVLKLYANVEAGGANSEVTIYMEGTYDSHLAANLPALPTAGIPFVVAAALGTL